MQLRDFLFINSNPGGTFENYTKIEKFIYQQDLHTILNDWRADSVK